MYTPYLGKNDHIADITNVEVIDENQIEIKEEINKLDCLYLRDDFKLEVIEDDFGDFSDDDIEDYFKYEEKLPYELEKNTNMYITKSFICTNMKIKKCSDTDVYRIKEKNIVFY